MAKSPQAEEWGRLILDGTMLRFGVWGRFREDEERQDEAERETRRSEIQRECERSARWGFKIRLIKVGVARSRQDSQALPEQ